MTAKQLTGARLYSLRMERHLTMDALCTILRQRFGVKLHRGVLSKWERGVNDPTLDYVRVLALFYDESLDYIAGMSSVRKHESH